MKELIKNRIFESSVLSSSLLNDDYFIENLKLIGEKAIETFKKGNRVFFAGNGGSGAQSQHLAAELSGRFLIDRAPLDAMCLSDNISFVTAVSNDYDYSKIFERSLEAHGNKGDLLFLLSTSGASENIIKLSTKAKELEIARVVFTGLNGIELATNCEFNVTVPSSDTARIQEIHLLCGHIICEIIEKELFGI